MTEKEDMQCKLHLQSLLGDTGDGIDDDFDLFDGALVAGESETSAKEAEDDNEEAEAEYDDFFAENKEEGELPAHMKDWYVESIHAGFAGELTPQKFERSQLVVHGRGFSCTSSLCT